MACHNTRLWILAGAGVTANLAIAVAAFSASGDRSWANLVAWAMLGALLVYPLRLTRQLVALDDHVLTHTERVRIVLGFIAPELLTLVLLFRALTAH